MNITSTGSSCQQLTAYIAAVPDHALTASSHPEGAANDGYGPENSRLFATGGWVALFDPEVSSTSLYIQVSE